jgi:hypothetical protein
VKFNLGNSSINNNNNNNNNNVTCQPIAGLRNRGFPVSCPLITLLRGWGKRCPLRVVSPQREGKNRPRSRHTRLQGNAINSLATARHRQQGRDVYSSLLSNRRRKSNWFSGNWREGYISSVTNITQQFVTSSSTSQLLRGVLQEVSLQRELKTLRATV